MTKTVSKSSMKGSKMPRTGVSTSKGIKRVKPVSKRSTAPQVAHLKLWNLAKKLAAQSGKLNFNYDPEEVAESTAMINKNTAKGRKNYKPVKEIYDQLIALNEEKILAMKGKGKFQQNVTWIIPSL